MRWNGERKFHNSQRQSSETEGEQAKRLISMGESKWASGPFHPKGKMAMGWKSQDTYGRL